MNSETYVDFVTKYEQFKLTREIAPELNESRGHTPESFFEHIDESIAKCHIFEINDNIKKLIMLTDATAMKHNEDLKLPFDYVFLDVKFTKEELKHFGISIKEDSIVGLFINLSKINNDFDEYQATTLRVTSMFKHDEYFDFHTVNEFLHIEEGVKAGINKMKNIKVGTKKFLFNFVVSFLNFLHNPEIEFVETSRNNKRRIKQGKIALPKSDKIKLTGKLKIYINHIESEQMFAYSGSWWVRGHFRVLSAKRYITKRRIFVLPYVKGKGELLVKNYSL